MKIILKIKNRFYIQKTYNEKQFRSLSEVGNILHVYSFLKKMTILWHNISPYSHFFNLKREVTDDKIQNLRTKGF